MSMTPSHRRSDDDDDDDDDYDPTRVVTAAVSTMTATQTTTTMTTTAQTLQHTRSTALASCRHSYSDGNHTNSNDDNVVHDDTVADMTASHNATPHEGGVRLLCGVARRGREAAAAATARVRCVALSSTHAVLCAGGDDGQLSMWAFDTARTTRTLHPTRVLTPFVNRIAGLQPIVAMHVACDDSYFVVCQDGDSPALVHASGKQGGMCAMGERGHIDVVRCKGHCAAVTSSSPHRVRASDFYTAAHDGTARLWDAHTCERGSRYAVKHGSGQLNDTVVVESVCGLSARCHGGGDVFATGGSDGVVQLWDARTRYRPGGAMATWRVYDDDDSNNDHDERHVGGMCEVVDATAAPALAVRVGMKVKVYDLRQPTQRGGDARGHVVAAPLLAQLRDALPCALDTTPLVQADAVAVTAAHKSSSSSNDARPAARLSCARDVLTCTSRAGYRHVVGGHVLRLSLRTNATAAATRPEATTLTCVRAWRAARSDEDVLCVCADTTCSDGDKNDVVDDKDADDSAVVRDTPLLFAGLSSGVVAVSLPPSSSSASSLTTSTGAAHSRRGRCHGRVADALQRWLASAPTRVVGVKSSSRDDAHDSKNDDDDALY